MNELQELIDLAHGILSTSGVGHIYPVRAIRALEDEIERRGLRYEYISALEMIVPWWEGEKRFTQYKRHYLVTWALMRATKM